ncbi:hypothetical protein [Nocardia sp. NBC_00511]|uniref:hypothetical protein n=1 Tax=Nocardia sp. NBC_00511 TaxID=2903591 RepID=UPI0030DDF58B
MRKIITVAVLAMAVAGGTAVTASAQPVATIQKQSPASESTLQAALTDYTHHIGETYTVYGKMYNVTSDSHAAFVTAGRTDTPALDGTSAELTGSAVNGVNEDDLFTASVTITGNEILGDAEVHVNTLQITGHYTY